MIVPQFWAEARVQSPRRKNETQVTVRRLGWSDSSPEEAQSMAQRRAEEALERIRQGDSLVARAEPKVAYNGAEGVPIREEILGKRGDIIITRNAYGAHCLNTPDVLIADIDDELNIGTRPLLVMAAALCILATTTVTVTGRTWLIFPFVLVVLLGAYPAVKGLRLLRDKAKGGARKAAIARIESFVAKHPDWRVRLYETPAGLRAMALHRCFAPNEGEVTEFFSAIGADPVYAAMCRRQQCFRARLTAKPWRIGVETHMKPRPGTWPIKPEQRAKRQAWVAAYEAKAKAFAACAFIKEVGNGTLADKARQVMELHDTLSQATSGRSLA